MKFIKIIVMIALLSQAKISEAQIVVKSFIDHVMPDDNDSLGSITPSVSGGQSPYTYKWTPGNITSTNLTSAMINSYRLSVKDSNNDSAVYNYGLGYKAVWTNFYRSMSRNDTLMTDNSSGSANRAAISRNILRPNTDGYVEMIYHPAFSLNVMGLIDSAEASNQANHYDIDIGVHISTGNALYVWDGLYWYYIGTASYGDVLRIERTSNVFYVKQNGTLIHTKTGINKSLKIKGLFNTGAIVAVGSSFADSTSTNSLRTLAFEDHLMSDGIDSEGGIMLKPSGGSSPYTYKWLPGNITTRNLSSISSGTYSLTLKDFKGDSTKYIYKIGYKAKWTNLTNCISRNDSLVTDGITGGVNRSAISRNVLSKNTDGYVEMVYHPSFYLNVMGLIDSSEVSNQINHYDLDIAVHVASGNALYVWDGTYWYYIATAKYGDVFRIERTSNVFYVKHNNVQVHTKSGINKDLRVKGLFNTGALVKVGTSFVDSLAVLPHSYVNVTPNILHSTGTNISDGSISLTPQSPLGAKTYTWIGNGSTSYGPDIIDKGYGSYSLTIKDSLGHIANYNYEILYKTRWTNLDGAYFINDTLSAASNYTLSDWRSALSDNTLLANQNGEISWQIHNISNKVAIGYLDNPSADHGVYSDIDYGIYQSNNQLYLLRTGSSIYLSECLKGDIVKIKRQSTTLNVSLNGVNIYTMSTSIADRDWTIKAVFPSDVILGNIATSVGNRNWPINTGDDAKLNWNQESTYDENGVVIGVEKTYLDNLGRGMQHLVKNNTNEVFRTQTVYDSYGRPAIQTKPAFTGSDLTFNSWFMRTSGGVAYGYSHFDTPSTFSNSANLETGLLNTLGNYYSDNNPHDAYQATAENPYTRTVYNAEPGGAPKSVSKPGNAFKQGSGRENYSFSMISGDELKYVFGSNQSYRAVVSATDALSCSSMSVSENIVASKHISISPDNKEVISYYVGDKLIASCFAGLSSETCNMSISQFAKYKGTQSIDIHLPDVNKNSLKFVFPTQPSFSSPTSVGDMVITITDLYKDYKLVYGTDYSIDGAGIVSFSSGFLGSYPGRGLILRITCKYTSAYESYLLTNNIEPADIEIDYLLDYGRFSMNYYDLSRALRKSVSPKGMGSTCSTLNNVTMASTYNYNSRGQLIALKTPDEGIIEAMYDNEGKLRFTQNSLQKSMGYFNYINYDKHARPIETGEYHSTNTTNSVWFPPFTYSAAISATAIVNQIDGLLNAEKTNTTIASYTVPSTADNIPSSYTYYSQYQNFRNGKLNYVKNSNSTVWKNYDKLGRDKANVVQITEANFVSKNPALDDRIKTVESNYNYYTGIVNTTTYQANNSNEKFKYDYGYDANYRPTTTNLSFGSSNELLLTNVYNKMGDVKRVVLGNNYQGMDFVYNLNGELKGINHPGLDASMDPGADNADYTGTTSNVNKDLFGEIIEYFNNDYQRSGNSFSVSSITSVNSKYNGLIYGLRFKTRNDVGSQVTGANYINWGGSPTNTLITNTSYQNQELRFEYQYDQFNQFAKSVFATYNNSTNSVTTRSEYSESGASSGNIDYDKNGNINRLVRQGHNSTTMDDLTYTNDPNGNKLTAILDASAYSSNFKTPSQSTSSLFGYNSIGQLTVSTAENIQSITYMPDGKVKLIAFTNSNTTCYEYGAMGEKIMSKYYIASANQYKYTWYVGPYIYEIDETISPTIKLAEIILNTGSLKVNATNLSSGAYVVYDIKDHLGNVRVQFKGTGTNSGIEILNYRDYFAFGGELPGRMINLTGRYGYQSQEKPDASNPWYQFELRNYNQDLGRWFAPDPYGQFESPYLAMANDPVSFIDPDGGWSSTDPVVSNKNGVVVHKSGYTHKSGDRCHAGDRKNKNNGSSSNSVDLDDGDLAIRTNGTTLPLMVEIDNDRDSQTEAGSRGPGGGTYHPDFGVTTDPITGRLTSKHLQEQQDALNSLIPIEGKVKNASKQVYTKLPTKSSNSSQSNGGGGASSALAVGWAVSLAEPTPIGEAVMTIATGAAVLYYGPGIVAKMQKEIDGIKQRAVGPMGTQYALTAKKSGYYPNVRGGTTYLNAGDVWKYGETTSSDRYSRKYLESMNLNFSPQFIGNQMEIKIQEKIMIYGYFFGNGSLPPGNSIFR